jgi:hypothetical protein
MIPIPNNSDKTNIPTIPNSNPTVDVNPKATITLYKLETLNTNSESIGFMQQALNLDDLRRDNAV